MITCLSFWKFLFKFLPFDALNAWFKHSQWSANDVWCLSDAVECKSSCFVKKFDAKSDNKSIFKHQFENIIRCSIICWSKYTIHWSAIQMRMFENSQNTNWVQWLKTPKWSYQRLINLNIFPLSPIIKSTWLMLGKTWGIKLHC